MHLCPVAEGRAYLRPDAPETYGALYEFREDEEEVDRRLAYWLQSFREANHPTVKRLTRAFELAGFACSPRSSSWRLASR